MNHIVIRKNSIIEEYSGITKKIYLISDWNANAKYYLNDLYDKCTDYDNLIELISVCNTLKDNYLQKIGVTILSDKKFIISINDNEKINIELYSKIKKGDIILSNYSKSDGDKEYYLELDDFYNVHKNDTIKKSILNSIKKIYKKVYSKYYTS